jgi:hypothetical protein
MSKNETIIVYTCGVAFQHEIGETDVRFYESEEQLKKKRTCWKECGIVKVEVKLIEWLEPQTIGTKK